MKMEFAIVSKISPSPFTYEFASSSTRLLTAWRVRTLISCMILSLLLSRTCRRIAKSSDALPLISCVIRFSASLKHSFKLRIGCWNTAATDASLLSIWEIRRSRNSTPLAS